MHKHRKGPGSSGAGKGFPRLHEAAPGKSDMMRLHLILSYGFSVASGYSDMSRDRHHVSLKNGASTERLLGFCTRYLKGSPFPGTNPITDGPILKRMFDEAQDAGLVVVQFVPADRFVPERAW